MLDVIVPMKIFEACGQKGESPLCDESIPDHGLPFFKNCRNGCVLNVKSFLSEAGRLKGLEVAQFKDGITDFPPIQNEQLIYASFGSVSRKIAGREAHP